MVQVTPFVNAYNAQYRLFELRVSLPQLTTSGLYGRLRTTRELLSRGSHQSWLSVLVKCPTHGCVGCATAVQTRYQPEVTGRPRCGRPRNRPRLFQTEAN